MLIFLYLSPILASVFICIIGFMFISAKHKQMIESNALFDVCRRMQYNNLEKSVWEVVRKLERERREEMLSLLGPR